MSCTCTDHAIRTQGGLPTRKYRRSSKWTEHFFSVDIKPFFLYLLTVHLDRIVSRNTNFRHNLCLVYFVGLYTFRVYQGPSSEGTTVCIQQLVLIILFRQLSVVLVGLELSILMVLPPDDGPRYAQNM
jgi:hypothetical protein